MASWLEKANFVEDPWSLSKYCYVHQLDDYMQEDMYVTYDTLEQFQMVASVLRPMLGDLKVNMGEQLGMYMKEAGLVRTCSLSCSCECEEEVCMTSVLLKG